MPHDIFLPYNLLLTPSCFCRAFGLIQDIPDFPNSISENLSLNLLSSQASLAINPASLMPGAGPRVPGAVSIIPDLVQSSSPRPESLLSAAAATAGLRVAAEGGISFDAPAQVTTLQNANKVSQTMAF